MIQLRFNSKSVLVALSLMAVFAVIVACGDSDSDPKNRNSGPIILSDDTIATPTQQPIADEPAAVPDGLQIVWEAYSILMREYVVREKIDPEVLAEAAVIGMLDALEDRYTSYVSQIGRAHV